MGLEDGTTAFPLIPNDPTHLCWLLMGVLKGSWNAVHRQPICEARDLDGANLKSWHAQARNGPKLQHPQIELQRRLPTCHETHHVQNTAVIAMHHLQIAKYVSSGASDVV